MSFNIKDFLKPGIIGKLLTGKFDPAEVLNGPFAQKISEGIISIINSFKAQAKEGEEIIVMVHEKNSEAFITIVSVTQLGSSLQIGSVLLETPVNKIGDLLSRMDANKNQNTSPTPALTAHETTA